MDLLPRLQDQLRLCNPQDLATLRIFIDHLVENQKETETTSFLSRMPPELLLRVFKFLDFLDLSRCQLVSRAWYTLANDPEVWKALFYRLSHKGCTVGPPAGQLSQPAWKLLCRALHRLSLNWLRGRPERVIPLPIFDEDEYYESSDMVSKGGVLAVIVRRDRVPSFVDLWNLKTLTLMPELKISGFSSRVDLTEDGKYLAVTNRRGECRVFDISKPSYSELQCFQLSENTVISISINELYVVAGTEEEVYVWNWRTGESCGKVYNAEEYHGDWVNSVALVGRHHVAIFTPTHRRIHLVNLASPAESKMLNLPFPKTPDHNKAPFDDSVSSASDMSDVDRNDAMLNMTCSANTHIAWSTESSLHLLRNVPALASSSSDLLTDWLCHVPRHPQDDQVWYLGYTRNDVIGQDRMVVNARSSVDLMHIAVYTLKDQNPVRSTPNYTTSNYQRTLVHMPCMIMNVDQEDETDWKSVMDEERVVISLGQTVFLVEFVPRLRAYGNGDGQNRAGDDDDERGDAWVARRLKEMVKIRIMRREGSQTTEEVSDASEDEEDEWLTEDEDEDEGEDEEDEEETDEPLM